MTYVKDEKLSDLIEVSTSNLDGQEWLLAYEDGEFKRIQVATYVEEFQFISDDLGELIQTDLGENLEINW